MSNPWRYRCPECRSVAIRERLDPRQAKEVLADRRFNEANTTENKFYCDGCQQALTEVWDAKRESTTSHMSF